MNDVLGGDELLGLARGFLRAGTPSLVVSLWMVNDKSTAQLMYRFYQGLQARLTKASALREAILEVKTDFSASLLLGTLHSAGQVLGVLT
jgi:CHAT domain-containing protein